MLQVTAVLPNSLLKPEKDQLISFWKIGRHSEKALLNTEEI